jgi:4-oxalocrotonate tautomerase
VLFYRTRNSTVVLFSRRIQVPYVNVRVIENVFTPEQKREMIEKVTDAMVEVEGEAMRDLTFVVVDETKSGDWGIGGRAMTTEDVQAHAAGS